MDAVDRQILETMATQGRTTLQELAERVHLGASATRERLRRLEQRGVITGYRAIVDEAAVGYPLEALVEVDLAPGADMQEFENRLRSLSGGRGAARHRRLGLPGAASLHRYGRATPRCAA
jgi:Lrp/AsnC family leucine-responsive transcriptional regulator